MPGANIAHRLTFFKIRQKSIGYFLTEVNKSLVTALADDFNSSVLEIKVFNVYAHELGYTKPCTEKNTKFMVFKLDDKDVEASFFGEPEIAPRPQGFPF